MNKFLKKRWLGIPIGIISAVLAFCLVAGGALAAIGVTETQIITQEIKAPPVAGSIIAENHELPSMQTNMPLKVFSWDDAVTVEVGTDGNNYLHLKLNVDSADLYTAYGVNIATADYVIFLSVTKLDPEDSIKLTAGTTYIFTETVNATTGPNAGSAQVKVTYTLEDA